MPIQLTTAKATIDGNVHDIVKILAYQGPTQMKRFQCTWVYGYMDGGSFVEGQIKRDDPLVLSGDDFDAVFHTEISATDKELWDIVADEVYQWMIANMAGMAGTIV